MKRTAPHDHLCADPVPFPFRQPIGGRAKGCQILDPIRQTKRIGARQIRRRILRLDQGGETGGIRRPLPHEAMRQFRLVPPRGLRQRTCHQLLTDPHAKATRQKLVEDQHLSRVQPVPCRKNRDAAGLIV